MTLIDEYLAGPQLLRQAVAGMSHEQLLLIETIRSQVARILRTLKPADLQRRGIQSEVGPLTLEAFAQRSTDHIPHHVRFIEEKRKAMALP